jgi:predicted GTPase
MSSTNFYNVCSLLWYVICLPHSEPKLGHVRAQNSSNLAANIKVVPATLQVDEGGERFLATVLRDSLDMHGVPVRLYLRQVQDISSC